MDKKKKLCREAQDILFSAKQYIALMLENEESASRSLHKIDDRVKQALSLLEGLSEQL